MFKQNPDIQKMKTRNELYFSKSPVAGSRENIFTSEGAQVAPLGTKIVRQIHKNIEGINLRGKPLTVSQLGLNLHGNKERELKDVFYRREFGKH